MKITDYPDFVSFLDKEKTATIAIPIDDSGTLHIATMLFSYELDPFRWYFVTSKLSEKCTLLRYTEKLVAAASVGTSYGTPYTLQTRGFVQIVDKSAHEPEIKRYHEKRGNTHDDITNHDTVLLEYTPNWGRFTDFSKGWDQTKLDLS